MKCFIYKPVSHRKQKSKELRKGGENCRRIFDKYGDKLA